MRNHSYLSIVLLLLSQNLLAQNSKTVTPAAENEKIRSVFVNVTGAAKFSKRVWAYLELELGDAGVEVVNAENKADAIVSVEVKKVEEIGHMSYGVTQLRMTNQGKTQSTETCGTISSEEDAREGLFSSSGEDIADQLREQYPAAKTILIKKTSDTSVAPKAREQLATGLKLKEFEPSDSENADLVVNISLVARKVSVQEVIVEYEYGVARRTRQTGALSGSGGNIFSAKVSSPPEVCPDRFSDLKWLARGNIALFELAQEVIKRVVEK